ncbi:MAG: cupredoxin domain-containing protein [Acidimicrobiales bacterium]
MTHRTLLALAIGSVGVACSEDYGSGSGGCTPSATEVCMTGSTFNPATRTVSASTTVTWRNGGGVTHTVTSNPGSGETFDQTVNNGGPFARAFNSPGTFSYHCMIHGSPTTGMRGTIVVN